MSAIRLNTTFDDNAPLTPVYGTPIGLPGAWKVADFKRPADYTIELDATQLRDVERAIRQIKGPASGSTICSANISSFPRCSP